jgi:hypothetical protein
VRTSADLLWAVLTRAYAQLGFEALGDDGFRAMVLARIVEPTSKAEVVRVLDEIGAPAVSLRTLFRSLARCQARDYRGQLAAAAWAHSARVSGAALVLYDVTTLHFERDDEDDLRKVGMSKERRVDPQVQAGLLTDRGGFPLEVHLFEGNKAETTTLIPVLSAFAQRYLLAMSTSPLSPDDIRAAAEVHAELGPEYRDAVVESFLAKIDNEVRARIDAQLETTPGVRRRGTDPVAAARRRGLAAGLALGTIVTGVPLTQLAIHLGNNGSTMTAWQSKLWFFWAVITIVYGTAAVLVWNRHRRQPAGNRQRSSGLTDRRSLEP